MPGGGGANAAALSVLLGQQGNATSGMLYPLAKSGDQFAMGRAWENQVAERLQYSIDTDKYTIVRDSTIKDPYTGVSIDLKHLYRPDFQIINNETGEPERMIDAKWRATQEGLDAAGAAAIDKYGTQSMLLPGRTEPVPVEIAGQVGPWETTSSLMEVMGPATFAVSLIDLLLGGGGPKFVLGPTHHPGPDGFCHA